MSTLREQMLAELQLKGLTPKTQKIYLREVRNYAKYFGKSPEELGEKELREYLLYLLNERKLAKGTYRFYYQGLKFLYKTHVETGRGRGEDPLSQREKEASGGSGPG